MIKIEHIESYGFEAAIRGMRNPMNSWDKSDTEVYANDIVKIGENDLKLMKQLYNAGTEHRKYLRQIMVSMDITAPLYWWKQMDQYRVGVTTNSCSTMHTLLKNPFELGDFSFENTIGYKEEPRQFKPEIDEETEIWQTYNDDYEVSSQGRIRKINNNKILSGSLHEDGYVFVTIYGKQIPLHRIVAELFCDNPENKLEVNHIDGNKQNNFAENLEWVTRAENVKHAFDTKLAPTPYNTYRGKFTSEQRAEIIGEWNNGNTSRRELAKKYNVSHTCINDIINGKYKYIEYVNVYEEIAKPIVDILNELRNSYIEIEDQNRKRDIWQSIIQVLPESYNQKRTITMNYENVVTIIKQRSNHKLQEWHDFCDTMLDNLPLIDNLINDKIPD